jgi:hypothetical protein
MGKIMLRILRSLYDTELGYRLTIGESSIDLLARTAIFILATASRSTLGPIQNRSYWETGNSFLGQNYQSLNIHLRLVLRAMEDGELYLHKKVNDHSGLYFQSSTLSQCLIVLYWDVHTFDAIVDGV